MQYLDNGDHHDSDADTRSPPASNNTLSSVFQGNAAIIIGYKLTH